MRMTWTIAAIADRTHITTANANRARVKPGVIVMGKAVSAVFFTIRKPTPLATQNPIEHHGTYPLPESQLDRFLMRIEMGYPDPAAEKEILKRFSNGNHKYSAEAVLDPTEVLFLQNESRKIRIDDSIVDYMIRIVNRTREHPEIELGISPRGTGALFRATQSLAMIDGRSFVIPDDIKKLVPPVFVHRLSLVRSGARARVDAKTILAEIIDQIPVPA